MLKLKRLIFINNKLTVHIIPINEFSDVFKYFLIPWLYLYLQNWIFYASLKLEWEKKVFCILKIIVKTVLRPFQLLTVENEHFLRKTKFTDLQILVWRKFFIKNFLRASTWRDPEILAKFSDLLFFVVATKKIYRIFIFCLVGAHLKNFPRARTLTPLKNCLNIK